MPAELAEGILLPFFGTALGAASVFILRGALHGRVLRALTGFAAGVMTAAAVWSLLIPAMEQASHMGRWAFFPAASGFWLGGLFLLALDRTIPHLHRAGNAPEGARVRLGRAAMLALAVVLHNIPEGMAVGVVLAGWMAGEETISVTGALALSIGIAAQNFPEGAIISIPLASEGMSRPRAFLYGALSGAAEPLAALLAMWAAVSAGLRGGSHALRGGGGADPGGVRRGALQHGNTVLFGGVHPDAGFGRSAEVRAGPGSPPFCRSVRKNSPSTCRHSSSRIPPTRAGVWGKSSMNRFSTPPQAPMAASRAP